VYGPEREKPFREAWAKTGKKLDMGKSCVRFKKVEDLALDVIGASIRQTSARKFIDYYERVLKETRSGAKRSRQARPATASKTGGRR
jgi:hypothetical protein